MPEPPATPAVRAREAEEAAEQELTDTTIIYGKALAAGGSESLVALMTWEAARDKHRDAVAARVTEELLERQQTLVRDQVREALHRKEDGWPGY